MVISCTLEKLISCPLAMPVKARSINMVIICLVIRFRFICELSFFILSSYQGNHTPLDDLLSVDIDALAYPQVGLYRLGYASESSIPSLIGVLGCEDQVAPTVVDVEIVELGDTHQNR